MRLYSSLLGAAIVLFDCVNASSARPYQTMVTATTPIQHDGPAQRFLRDDAKTNREERGGVSSSASNHEENDLFSYLMTEGNSVEDAFTSLKLHIEKLIDSPDQEKLHTLPFNLWVSYAVAKAPAVFSDGIMENVREKYGFHGLMEMLKAFITVKGAKGVVLKLESKLIAVLKEKNTPMKEALSQLGLDKPTDALLRKRLLKTWVKYGYIKRGARIPTMVAAINGCDEEIRVAILEGLGKIKGTDEVVEGCLSTLMNSLEERKAGADYIVKLFKLDQPLHFDMWVKYVARTPSSLLKSLEEKVWNLYDNEGRVKVLTAFIMAKGTEDVVLKLESKLIDSWWAENTPMKEALSQLGLDKPTDALLRKRLLNTWVEYGKKVNDATNEMVDAINGSSDKIRVAALKGLKNIEGTKSVVNEVESSLMTSYKEKELSVDVEFKFLNLDEPGEGNVVKTKSAFTNWVQDAAASGKVLSEETIRIVYEFSDMRFLEMYQAFSKAGHREEIVRMLRVLQEDN